MDNARASPYKSLITDSSPAIRDIIRTQTSYTFNGELRFRYNISSYRHAVFIYLLQKYDSLEPNQQKEYLIAAESGLRLVEQFISGNPGYLNYFAISNLPISELDSLLLARIVEQRARHLHAYVRNKFASDILGNASIWSRLTNVNGMSPIPVEDPFSRIQNMDGAYANDYAFIAGSYDVNAEVQALRGDVKTIQAALCNQSQQPPDSEPLFNLLGNLMKEIGIPMEEGHPEQLDGKGSFGKD